jgi:hypothetical protein
MEGSGGTGPLHIGHVQALETVVPVSAGGDGGDRGG